MPGQRARSAVEADHRSAHPDIPGVPWWGAILIAVAGTALGFAFDAMVGGSQLTPLFAGCYAAGCVVAVLAVRQASIFTAVVQPPLILFSAVPMAYLLMSNASLSGGKSTALTIGYPLVERFPLMISTALGVLIIGAVRWYWGMFAPKKPAATTEKKKAKTKPRKAAEDTDTGRTRVKTLVDAEARSARMRGEKPAGAPARTRHSRQGSARPHRETPTRRALANYDAEPRQERERPVPSERRGPRRYADQYGDRYEDRYDDRYDPYPSPPPRYRETRVRYRDEAPPAPRTSQKPRPRQSPYRDDPYEPPSRRRRHEDPSDQWDYDR